MSVPEPSIAGKQPFRNPGAIASAFASRESAMLAMAAGDVSLLLNAAGQILDGSADPADFPGLTDWIGRDWASTVTVESRPKIADMLAAARRGELARWRQVNHPSPRGDIPVRYLVVGLAEKGALLAIGHDMRGSAELQQRLLQTQQSLERDYLRLRQTEARYRLLFDLSSEPVLIVDADDFTVREANPAAHLALHAAPGRLVGQKIAALFAPASRDPLIAFLGAASSAGTVAPTSVRLARGGPALAISASGFRQQGGRLLLVRLGRPDQKADPRERVTLDVIDRMPDAFVLTDRAMLIVAANPAFVELAGAASESQLVGRALGDLVGRPGVDLDLVEGQLARHGEVRNLGTIVRSANAVDEEPIELSAVRAGSDDAPYFGFSIRRVGRRASELPPSARDLPRSVEQLTGLVGRMSLKDIVRESTDLIERLCIEAALTYTSDNRASAAEVLGLSRQSLYAKLHRYGLGNLVADQD
ncbi:transcriptional regulator PpsR [Sphingomonas sp. ASV193]|uniref:transcriptional regulator PpsR n=1 Tax=Sphingomonas sp. ASV193 TaxID=3144405 RepID=UPI0032E907A3